jgi:DNA-binding NarL/FixJ family response regulator
MPPHFTPRDLSILAVMPNPLLHSAKQMALALGITEGTLKVDCRKIYEKLGWPHGTLRLLTIWAMTHDHVIPSNDGCMLRDERK